MSLVNAWVRIVHAATPAETNEDWIDGRSFPMMVA